MPTQLLRSTKDLFRFAWKEAGAKLIVTCILEGQAGLVGDVARLGEGGQHLNDLGSSGFFAVSHAATLPHLTIVLLNPKP